MELKRLIDLSEATDAATFERQLLGLAEEMEFGRLAAAVVVEIPGAPAHVARIGNTPEAFLNSSTSAEESSRDPVLQRLKTSSVPVVYDQGTYVRANAGDLWEMQAPFGYKTGIAAALHLPGNRHFILGLDRDEALPSSDEKLVRMLGDLQLLIVHAQEPALNLLGRPPTHIVLTSREEMILRMTRDGKSGKVIGDQLCVAHVTVKFHLQNVMHKFGVSSKHQAVQRAQALGLI